MNIDNLTKKKLAYLKESCDRANSPLEYLGPSLDQETSSEGSSMFPGGRPYDPDRPKQSFEESAEAERNKRGKEFDPQAQDGLALFQNNYQPGAQCNEIMRDIVTSDGFKRGVVNAVVAGMQRGAIEQQKTNGEIERAKIKEDVKSRRELQKTIVSIDPSGGIKLSHETFGGGLSDWASFRIGGVIIRYSCGGNEGVDDEILMIPFVNIKGENLMVFLNLQRLTKKGINSAFDRQGLSFGFGEKKEYEARTSLVRSAIEVATEKVLPPYHGFWKDGSAWAYAYPDTMTMREMMHYV